MFFSSLRFRLSSCWRRSYGRCVSRVHPQRGEQQLKLQSPSQLFPPHDQNVPSQSEVQPLSQLSSHSLTIRPRRLSGNSPWSPRTCSSVEGTSLPCASPSEGSPQPLTVESIIARWINIVVEESMCVRLLSSARGCEAAAGTLKHGPTPSAFGMAGQAQCRRDHALVLRRPHAGERTDLRRRLGWRSRSGGEEAIRHEAIMAD